MMKCREAKAEIALYLGHDQSDRSVWEEVRRHVSTCEGCRSHYHSMKSALSALEASETEATYEVRSSIWPELSKRLDTPQSPPKSAPRRWVPLASVMVACLTFVAVFMHQPEQVDGPVVPAQWSLLPTWRANDSRDLKRNTHNNALPTIDDLAEDEADEHKLPAEPDRHL